MKTHDITDDEGRVFAFEIDNLLIRRGGVARIIEGLPDCIIISREKGFIESLCGQIDQFLEFEIDGECFIAEEPFGDNSRYWIGPKFNEGEKIEWCAQFEVVRDAFTKANPIGILNR